VHEQLELARAEHSRLVGGAAAEARQMRLAAEQRAAEIITEAERRAHTTFTDAENRAEKALAAAEDRMTQLKVERVAVARYFESLGDVVNNAQRLERSARGATEQSLEPQTEKPSPAPVDHGDEG